MLSPHPLAELFPPMDDVTYAALVESIKNTGLLDTVTLYEGKILDGRARYRACLDAGVPPRFKNFDGRGDPVSYLLSMNLYRGHFSQAEVARVKAAVAALKAGSK